MTAKIRMTVAVATVVNVFLQDTDQPRYGYELMQLTGFPSGKLYPILARLEGAGWLTKQWETVDPATAGRPPRRWYRLRREAQTAAREAIASLRRQIAPRAASSSERPLRPGHGVA